MRKRDFQKRQHLVRLRLPTMQLYLRYRKCSNVISPSGNAKSATSLIKKKTPAALLASSQKMAPPNRKRINRLSLAPPTNRSCSPPIQRQLPRHRLLHGHSALILQRQPPHGILSGHSTLLRRPKVDSNSANRRSGQLPV